MIYFAAQIPFQASVLVHSFVEMVRFWVVFSVIVLACLFARCESKYSESLKVVLSHGGGVYGRYASSKSGRGIRAFRGIPYAEPPVGDLRFADPVDKKSWTGFLDGEKNRVICSQIDALFGSNTYEGQEDCLYLNVYVPQITKTKEPLPIMVFFHGGGYQSGSGQHYGPQYLLDNEVILVTGNYRLGALGYLSTASSEAPGNFGMKDQVMILKWVRQNIHLFGGDPNKVTIFGESAGSASVALHMTSPLSRGLFHQGIMQSGTIYSPWAMTDQKTIRNNTKKLLGFLECPFEDEKMAEGIACLRGKTAQEITEQFDKFSDHGTEYQMVFRPVFEPASSLNPFINEQSYNAGPDPKIPIIIGLTSQEGAIRAAPIGDNPELVKAMETNFDENIPYVMFYGGLEEKAKTELIQKWKTFYLQNKPFSWASDRYTFMDMLTDSWMLAGINTLLTKRFASGQAQNTYVYLFSYRGEASTTDLLQSDPENVIDYGVSHCDELLYLFPLAEELISSRIPSEVDNRFREKFAKMWVDFAHFGQPSKPPKPSKPIDPAKDSKSSKQSKPPKEPKWKPATAFPLEYVKFEAVPQATTTPTPPPKTHKDKNHKHQKEYKEQKEPKMEFMTMEVGLYTQRSEFWNQIINSPALAPVKDEL